MHRRRGAEEEEEAEESRRRRGWISNMLGQMHRPTVVCHSYSRLFLFLLHLVSIISPSFILGAGFPSVFISLPSPASCLLYSDLLALSPFFPAVQLARSVLHAPQEFTYSLSSLPARLAHGTQPTPALPPRKVVI